MKRVFLDTKKKRTVQQAVLVAGKTKKEKHGGKKRRKNVTKSKKAKNFGRVPQQIISSQPGLGGGTIC